MRSLLTVPVPVHRPHGLRAFADVFPLPTINTDRSGLALFDPGIDDINTAHFFSYVMFFSFSFLFFSFSFSFSLSVLVCQQVIHI